MKKTLALTFALLVLAAGLATYVLVVEKKPAPEPSTQEWQPTLVLAEGNTVNQVTLVRPTDTIVFMAVPNSNLWRIEKPIHALAEPIYAEMLMRDIVRMKREKIIDLAPDDLAKYQLDQPRGEIIAHYSNGHPDTHVLIGKMNYNQDHLFAKLADQPTVFLIKPDLNNYLTATLTDFRSKALFLNYPGNVISIEIKIDDPALKQQFPAAIEPKLVVQSQPNAKPQWAIVSPVHENVEFAKVKKFFTRLTNVSANQVFDSQGGDLDKFGLEKPAARIIFTMQNGQKEQIDFGARDPETGDVYARNTMLTQIVPLNPEYFAYLINGSFRDEKILGALKIVNLSSLSIEFPQEPQNNMLIKKEYATLFHFDDDPQIKVVGTDLANVLTSFMQYDVVFINQLEPLPLQKYGLDPGNVRIKAYDGENPALDVILGDTITQQGVTQTFVKDGLRDCIVLVPANLYDKIPLKKEFLTATPEELQKIKQRRLRRKQ